MRRGSDNYAGPPWASGTLGDRLPFALPRFAGGSIVAVGTSITRAVLRAVCEAEAIATGGRPAAQLGAVFEYVQEVALIHACPVPTPLHAALIQRATQA